MNRTTDNNKLIGRRLAESVVAFSTATGVGLYLGADAVLGSKPVRVAFSLIMLTAAWALYMAFFSATAAFAQDVINSTLQNVITSVSGWMRNLGILGFLVGAAIKATAGTNEGRHHLSHMAMGGSVIAVVVAILAPGIMDMAEGWGGGGGGGGRN